jgi:ABC-type branched-subunit amino acid transport system substrate-binding protein
VRLDGYDFAAPDQNALVAAYVQFAPDIVVLAGTAEAVTRVLVPLEQQWKDAAKPRPYYMLTDSSKVPELLAAVAGNEDLRRRVRGTGVTPSPASVPVYNAFRLDYGATFDGSVTYSGMGPAYDAAYAIAYAIAATHERPVTGSNIAEGLRRLGTGRRVVEVGLTTVQAAFQELVAGENIRALGTFSPLEWNANGAVASATLEMWCVMSGALGPAYGSSGLTFDIGTQTFAGSYAGCEP